MLDALQITALHDQLNETWHREALESWLPPAQPWLALVAQQHLANFELWHTEDAARATNVTDEQLARIKRHIDATNQRRNDLAEAMDAQLLAWLAPFDLPNPNAELHSESPGLMIDRLSILSLKIFHTTEEIERVDASNSHRERNRQRLTTLAIQRADLAGCLGQLWSQTEKGTRRFKLYQQLKMYNDPTLNPAVYRHG